MPTLYLLRHVKSSWDDDALADHDRPLSARGRTAGERLRRHCLEAKVEPQLVLCSTAARARATLAAVLPERDDALFEGELYLASGPALAARVRALGGESALIVAHNPGLQELVLALTPPSPLRSRVEEKLPTGALVTIRLTSWTAEVGELVALVVPRELS